MVSHLKRMQKPVRSRSMVLIVKQLDKRRQRSAVFAHLNPIMVRAFVMLARRFAAKLGRLEREPSNMANKSRSVARTRRHSRVRKNLTGSVQRPRLNVFRSLSGIYAQVIDDQAGNTLVSASTVDKDLREKVKGLKKAEQANLVGKTVAQR